MIEFDKEWVEAYFDHGIDIANRRVFLDSDIESDSIGAAVRGLYLMQTQGDEKIDLFISSYGGSVYETLALYDIIRTIPIPIHTFAYGKCMSAAPLLLACGEPGHRWVAPHVSLMHHDMSSDEEGTRSFLHSSIKEIESLYKEWITLLAQHSTKTYKWWDAKSRLPGDFYYSAEDAIDWGLADQMWVER